MTQPGDRFIGRLVTEGIAPFRWRLVEDFGYQSDLLGKILVPARFVSDFASVPRLFWNIIPLNDAVYDKAAVLHDFLLEQGKYPRAICDKLFLEVLTYCQVPPWKRTLMYTAVRGYGIISRRFSAGGPNKLAGFSGFMP